MTLLVPLMMYGWPLLGVILFSKMPAHRAAAILVVGGLLFLPNYSYYNVPIIPAYDKSAAIAMALMAGWISSGAKERLKWHIMDLPMLLWVFASPVLTSLSNGLGLYDGVSGSVSAYLSWGAFYLAGRLFFQERESLRVLFLGIIIGGLLYILPILFEVRMSPQLSYMFYGFFPHSFAQHVRYGGYRPIVFMEHGLMVSLWMSMSAVMAFWAWRSKEIKDIKGIPILVVTAVLAAGVVLCKSANGIVFMLLGFLAALAWGRKGRTGFMLILFMIVPGYILFRLQNFITVEELIANLGRIFDPERIESLSVRLRQEDLFGARTMMQPFFGWGSFGRGWPMDPLTGLTIGWVDSLWVIVSNTYGIFGLVVWLGGMGLGALAHLVSLARPRPLGSAPLPSHAWPAVALSLVVTLFLLDSLMNGMVNPVYILCAGALVSYRVAAEPLAQAAPQGVSVLPKP